VTQLHFNGTLAPLSIQSVLSPLDGRVTQVLFEYGQHITKGQTLVLLDAVKLSEDYRKTVSDYLEKKQAYENGQTAYKGNQALFKAGVISKEEYLNAESRQRSDTLSFYQAKYDLEKLLAQTSVPLSSIENLNLSDMARVNALLNRQFQAIKIFSPSEGIALFPSPEQKKETTGTGRISVGDDIKSGQLILGIGDLSGFTLKLTVSEIAINLIKPNLPAIVTGSAFPGTELKGYVNSVASQANPQTSSEGGLGMFEVIVKVPQVSLQQQRNIRVGMSAAVELDIPEAPQIYVPLAAVHQTNGQRAVTVVDKNGQRHEVPVVTGKTTLTEVAIITGLQPGDQVVVPH
jgi:HlyD family secretion protein